MWSAAAWLCVLFAGTCAGSAARLEGDVVVGGLFAVHGAAGAGAGGCGALVREHYGIQRVEAALRALRAASADGVRLGAELRDSCWAPHSALRQALALVRERSTCGARPDGQATPLLAVLGPGGSAASAQVQNLLQLFSVPQVSYSATARELSDRARFSTFFRVVPPDTHQARVLLALLKAHNWTYVHALYTDESYGQSGIAVFRELAAAAGVCVAREEALRAEPIAAEVDAVLSRVASAASRVALCWCEGRTVRALLAGVARGGGGPGLRLVGSDGWADRGDVVAGWEEAAQGALTVKIRSPPLAHFDDYYTSLKPHNNTDNPWFKEFWEQKFNCSLADPLPVGVRQCTGNESLREGYTQEPKLALVVRGVLAVARALHDMRAAICPPRSPALCPAMLPFNISLYKSFLSRVRFRAPDGGLVAFDENGDPPPESSEYDVMSFERRGAGYGYVRVGAWRGGRLRLIRARARARDTHAACSPPCPLGHYKEAAGEGGALCCWACVPCGDDAVPAANGSGCVPCPMGSTAAGSDCRRVPVTWGGGNAEARRAVAVAAAAGLVGAVLAATALWKHRSTPVVKAASRELVALQLAATALCHATALAALLRPSAAACAATRLAAPALAAQYAAVLARTLRVARLVAISRSPSRPQRLLSGRAQPALWAAMWAPAAAAAGWSAAAKPPEPALWHPARARSVLRCGGEGPGLLVPLAPALLLLLTCAALAVRTRRLPHNYNEARFIGAAVYATCLIWIAFFPVFAVTENKTLALCGAVSISAGVCVSLSVWPRVWVCVCRPQRNTRAHFITARSIRCHVGRYAPAVAAGAHSGSADAGTQTRAACAARVWELHTGGDTADILIALLPHSCTPTDPVHDV